MSHHNSPHNKGQITYQSCKHNSRQDRKLFDLNQG